MKKAATKKPTNVLSIVPQLEQKRKETQYLTVKEALEEALADIQKEPDPDNVFTTANKVLVIALDDVGGGYRTAWIQGGMKMSECVGLVEVVKARFLQKMGK